MKGIPDQLSVNVFKSLSLLGIILAVVVGLGANASATMIDSAVINTRIFNDAPGSTLTTVNNYPALIEISDTGTGGGGFAQRIRYRAGVDIVQQNRQTPARAANA